MVYQKFLLSLINFQLSFDFVSLTFLQYGFLIINVKFTQIQQAQNNQTLLLIKMKSYQKHIRFENIELKVEKQHPKDISRVHFLLTSTTKEVHKTKKYGTVNPTNIIWHCPIQFKYLAQPSFKFQTICEHQYGYEIEQLKALYCGEINIKPQDFFVTNHFNVFNKSGEKCGKVSFMIKIVDREVGVKYNQDDEVENKERIRVDLASRVTFIQGNLLIYANYIKDYQGKKSITSKSDLIIKIDGIQMIAHQKDKNKWIFRHLNKVELFEKSQDRFLIQIKDGESIILSGFLFIDILLKNKRFLTQSIIMQNQKGTKIGTLKLQMRIVQKKQILDLMYSPNKLQNARMEKTQFDTELSRVQETFQKKTNSSEPVLSHLKKRMSLNMRNKDLTLTNLSHMQSSEASSTSRTDQKYDLYFRNRYQNIKFSQSKRFQDVKLKNPHISYSGQEERSDFSPKKKHRGANFSKTERTDFTKPFKNHPGIGDYHLPSIWEKS